MSKKTDDYNAILKEIEQEEMKEIFDEICAKTTFNALNGNNKFTKEEEQEMNEAMKHKMRMLKASFNKEFK